MSFSSSSSKGTKRKAGEFDFRCRRCTIEIVSDEEPQLCQFCSEKVEHKRTNKKLKIAPCEACGSRKREGRKLVNDILLCDACQCLSEEQYLPDSEDSSTSELQVREAVIAINPEFKRIDPEEADFFAMVPDEFHRWEAKWNSNPRTSIPFGNNSKAFAERVYSRMPDPYARSEFAALDTKRRARAKELNDEAWYKCYISQAAKFAKAAAVYAQWTNVDNPTSTSSSSSTPSS